MRQWPDRDWRTLHGSGGWVGKRSRKTRRRSSPATCGMLRASRFSTCRGACTDTTCSSGMLPKRFFAGMELAVETMLDNDVIFGLEG